MDSSEPIAHSHSTNVGSTEQEHDLISTLDLSNLEDLELGRFLPAHREDNNVVVVPNDEFNGTELNERVRAESSDHPRPITEAAGRKRAITDEVSESGEGDSSLDDRFKRRRVREDRSPPMVGSETMIASIGQEISRTGQENDLNRSRSRSKEDAPSQFASSSKELPVEAGSSANIVPAILTPAELLEAPPDQLTPEQKKERQKEANRLAALRSRGRKRNAVASLEQIVDALGDENAKLRARLESLMADAAESNVARQAITPQEQPINTIDLMSRPVPMTADGRDLGSRLEGNGDPEDLISSALGGDEAALDPDLDLDLSAINMLRQRVAELRERVAAKQATEGSAGFAAPSDARKALVSHIKHLKAERQKIENERRVVEREITQRKLLLAADDKAKEDNQRLAEQAERLVARAETGDFDNEQPNENNAKGKRRAKEDGIEVQAEEEEEAVSGVERALLHIRGWLDQAHKSWKETGVLVIPETHLQSNAIPILQSARRPARASRPKVLRPGPRNARLTAGDRSEASEAHHPSRGTENTEESSQLNVGEIDPSLDPAMTVDPAGSEDQTRYRSPSPQPNPLDGEHSIPNPRSPDEQDEDDRRAQAQRNLQQILDLYHHASIPEVSEQSNPGQSAEGNVMDYWHREGMDRA